MLLHRRGQHVALGKQVGAAVMVDDALGIAGGAGSIVERDGVPFILGHPPFELGIAAGEELLVFDVAKAGAVDGKLRVVVVDDDGPGGLGERERGFDGASRIPCRR